MTWSDRAGSITSSSSSSTQVDSQVIMHTVVPLPECPHLVEVFSLLLLFFKLTAYVVIGIFEIRRLML